MSPVVSSEAKKLVQHVSELYDPATGVLARNVGKRFRKQHFLENEIPKLIWLAYDHRDDLTQVKRNGLGFLCDAVGLPRDELDEPSRLGQLAPWSFDPPRAARLVPKLLFGLRMLNGSTPAEGKATRPRRRRADSEPKPLTDKQIEAAQIVAEYKGNITKAAKALGRDRKTVQQNYHAGLRKLGKQAVKGVKTVGTPRDRRGQDRLTEDRRQS